MRILLTILAVGALANAVEVDNKYGMHYSQHRSSVDTARLGMQERLSKLEQQTAYQRQYGANDNYVATGCTTGCTTGSSAAYSSRSSSSSSSQRNSASALDNSDYVGVGIVSHDDYGNDENDLQQRVSSRYTGSGYESDDVQQRVVPGDLSNIQSAAYRQAAASRSSYKSEHEEEEEDLQRTVGAGYHDLSVNNDRYVESQSQRRAQQSQKESELRVSSGGRTVPVYYVPGGSSSSSTYRSTGSNAESQYSESRTTKPVSVGQYVSMAVRPGTSTILTIPVAAQDQQRVYSSSDRRDYQAGSEASRTRVQPGYQINHYPSYSSDRTSSSGTRSDSQTSRTVAVQQPEKLTSTDYSRSRYNEEEIDEEDTQQRISPANSGSTRVVSSGAGGSTNYQQGYTSSRVVPAFPVHTIESASSQRTAEEREQRQFSQSRPTYTQRTTALSRNENDQSSGSSQYTTVNRPVYSTSRIAESDGRTYGSSGTTVYTAPVSSTRTQLQSQNQQGLSQSNYQAGSASQNQYQAGASQNQYQAGASQNQYQAGSGSRTGYGGYQSRISGNAAQRGASDSTSRFSSTAVGTNAEDLNVYMSESERLARIQQQQIANSQRTSSQVSATEANRRTVNTANALDATAAQFVSSNNLASRLSDFDNVETLGNTGGAGGYKRVKSWQKQSKWASGSEYGTDGNPKSYSMLSTAEAEKHNINGAETGYKAATTTLENDGKVSTYSIHTP